MVIYRRAGPKDSAGLEDCFRRLQDFERTLEPNRAKGRTVCKEYVARLFEQCATHKGAVHVAEVGGRIVAFVCVLGRVDSEEIIEAEPEHAYVTDLYVDEEHRGAGIGEQLMEGAELHARSCGATRLKVGVLSANTRAHRFYERMGFRDNEVVLEKRLDNP